MPKTIINIPSRQPAAVVKTEIDDRSIRIRVIDFTCPKTGKKMSKIFINGCLADIKPKL